MNGLWIWPSDEKSRKKLTNKLAKSEEIKNALLALSKKPEGMTNFELEEAIGNNAIWVGIWTIRQLLALELIEYKHILFGEAGHYVLTEKGKEVLQTIQGQPQSATPRTH